MTIKLGRIFNTEQDNISNTYVYMYNAQLNTTLYRNIRNNFTTFVLKCYLQYLHILQVQTHYYLNYIIQFWVC